MKPIHTSHYLLAASLLLLAPPPPAPAGEIIEIRNNSDTTSFVLSDLIVKGKAGEKSTVLKLGDASDDQTLGPRKSVTFDVGFDIESYFVSRTGETGEHETFVFDISFPGFTKVGMVENAGAGPAVFAAIDASFPPADPLAPGNIIDIIDGFTPLLPGWFFGSTADFDAFVVSNPFTGGIRFLDSDVAVRVLPQPATFSLLLGGGLVIAAMRYKRRISPRNTVN